MERDALFLARCVQLLRPGGRLGIVLPHNKFAGSGWSYLRERPGSSLGQTAWERADHDLESVVEQFELFTRTHGIEWSI